MPVRSRNATVRDPGQPTPSLLAQTVPQHLRQPLRIDRVELLLAAAESLRVGRPVNPEIGAVLGRALHDWLVHGGDLGRRLGVARRGSHVRHMDLARVVLAAVATVRDGRADETFSIAASSLDDDS